MYSVKSATVSAGLGVVFLLFAFQVSAAPKPDDYNNEPMKFDFACIDDEPQIDLDFRLDVFDPQLSPDEPNVSKWKNVRVEAFGGSLDWNGCDADGLPGFGIGGDGYIERGETLVIDLVGAENAPETNTFDVDGMWVGFKLDYKGNSEVCEVTLNEYGGTSKTYPVIWDNADNAVADEGANPNHEVLINFEGADPRRIVRAEITGTSGLCRVIGFTNSPIRFGEDEGDSQCPPPPGEPEDACKFKLAQGFTFEAEFANKVEGDLYKQGVTVISDGQDDRDHCVNGLTLAELQPGNELEPLRVDVDADGVPDVDIPGEFCGIADDNGDRFVNVLVIRSTLEVEADILKLRIENAPGFDCKEPSDVGFDPLHREVVLRAPNNLEYFEPDPNDVFHFQEIPHLIELEEGWADYEGNTTDGGIEIPVVARNISVNECGSFRGNGFSLFPHHLTLVGPAEGVDEEAFVYALHKRLSERTLHELEVYAEAIRPCMDRYGTGQSSLQYYLNLIRNNFDRENYSRMVGNINEFIGRLEDPNSHLYLDLVSCNFDLAYNAYPFSLDGQNESDTPFIEPPDPEGATTAGPYEVWSNATGYLRAQLRHLLWLAAGLPQ